MDRSDLEVMIFGLVAMVVAGLWAVTGGVSGLSQTGPWIAVLVGACLAEVLLMRFTGSLPGTWFWALVGGLFHTSAERPVRVTINVMTACTTAWLVARFLMPAIWQLLVGGLKG